MATCNWKKCLAKAVWDFILWFGAIPTLTSAAVALGGLEGRIECGILNVTSHLVTPTQGVAGFLIGISGFTILILQLYRIPEMLRACKVRVLDPHLVAFYAVVIFFNVFLMLGFLAGGAAATYYAVQWHVGNMVGNALTSAAVFSYLGGILQLVSMTSTIILLAFGWHEEDRDTYWVNR